MGRGVILDRRTGLSAWDAGRPASATPAARPEIGPPVARKPLSSVRKSACPVHHLTAVRAATNGAPPLTAP